MKKVIIAVGIALAATSAFAVDISGRGVYDWSGSDQGGAGFAISQSVNAGAVGAVRGSLEVSRAWTGANNVDQYALVATKDVVKLPYNAAVGIRAGAAYVEVQNGTGGAAGLLGIGLTVPLNKQFAVEAGFDRRFVENRVGPDGNVGFVGLRVSF
jgi:hypothetical protein